MTKSEPLRSPNEYKIYVEQLTETLVNSPKPNSTLHQLLPNLRKPIGLIEKNHVK